MKILNYTVQIVAAISVATAASQVWAADTSDASGTSSVAGVLSSVPNDQLPTKVAALISQADAIHQPLVTSEAIKAALQASPGSANLVITTVAKTVPGMAANAALAAASVYPGQAPAFAKAAATGAPQMAGQIVKVLCRALPTSFRAIAEAVSSAVPGAAKEILDAVASAIPSLKPTIAQVEAMHDGGYISVYEVLAEVGDSPDLDSTLTTQDSGVRGIHISRPPTAPASLPPVINTSAGSPVPPGGRTDAQL